MNTHGIVLRILIFVLLNTISACTKRVTVLTQPPFAEKERLLYVELSSGEIIKVKEPHFKGGFLFGKTPIYETRPGPDKEIKIRLEEITSIEVERFDEIKTVISLTAIPLAIYTFFYVFIQTAGAGRGLK